MPTHISALAIRAAVVASATTAAAVAVVLPATPAAAAPAPVPAVTAPVVATPVLTAPVVTAAVAPAALAVPAAADPAAIRMAATNNALSKLGARYRWGAAGPNAFDCSGLVNWSFRQAGVPLPRTSRAMSRVGTPVAKADLVPGDLVFFYRPVSHVAIYIGDGKVVHASTSRKPVMISDLNRMPFHSARRI